MDSIEEKIVRYQRTKNCDEVLFQEIRDYFLPMIRSRVSSKIWNTEDAKDVVQECVIALWTSLTTWNKTIGPFENLLNRIISNKLINYYRTEKRKEKEIGGFFGPVEPDVRPGGGNEPGGKPDPTPIIRERLELGKTWNAFLNSCAQLTACPQTKRIFLRFRLDHQLPDDENTVIKTLASWREKVTLAFSLESKERALLANLLTHNAAASKRKSDNIAQRATHYFSLRKDLLRRNRSAAYRASIWKYWALTEVAAGKPL